MTSMQSKQNDLQVGAKPSVTLPREGVQRAIEALDAARNGLRWYRNEFPAVDSGADDEAMEQIVQSATALTAALAAPGPQIMQLPPLDDALLGILGRPNFLCSPIAQILRIGGHAIQRRAEAEQAHVIYWALSLYATHGPDWGKHANIALRSMLDAAKAAGVEGENHVG